MAVRNGVVARGPAHAAGQRGRELGGVCLKIYQVGNGSWSQSFILNDRQDEDKVLKGFKNWDKGAYFWNDKEGAREALQREASQSKQQGRKMTHARWKQRARLHLSKLEKVRREIKIESMKATG